MDEHLRRLLREYAIQPTDDLAHRISHALLRSNSLAYPREEEGEEEDTFDPDLCSHEAAFETSPGEWYCPGCSTAIPYEEEEEEEEEDENEEDRDEGFWECANCGDELFESGEGELWTFLGEAGAAVAAIKLGRGSEGEAMCDDCLAQADLDLEQGAQDTLEEFCLRCGELEEECECDED